MPGAATRSTHSAFTQACPMFPGLVAPAMHGRALVDAAAIAAGQKLPLLQREVRQLIHADEKIFRALIAVNIVLRVAVCEARRRTVQPRDDVLGFVIFFVQLARHVPPEIRDQRSLQLRKRSPQQQRVHARMQCAW